MELLLVLLVLVVLKGVLERAANLNTLRQC